MVAIGMSQRKVGIKEKKVEGEHKNDAQKGFCNPVN